MAINEPDKQLNIQLIILTILIICAACSPIIYIFWCFLTYEPPTTKIVNTLTCSGVIITDNQDYLYTTRGGMYEFTNGSYTPKQGEICIVQRKEVKL